MSAEGIMPETSAEAYALPHGVSDGDIRTLIDLGLENVTVATPVDDPSSEF